MNKDKIAIFTVSVMVLIALFFVFTHKSGDLKPKTLSIGDAVIVIDIADNEILREKGLSGRQTLSDSSGMLFIFPEVSTPGFWMKEMLFPLDIIWISEDKKVVSVSENLKPESYPSVFYPTGPVKYVLEVPTGFSQKHNVSIGEPLSF